MSKELPLSELQFYEKLKTIKTESRYQQKPPIRRKDDWMKVLGDKYSEVWFSDYKNKNSEIIGYSTLIFNKEEIRLTENKKDNRKIYVYNYASQDLILNSQPVNHRKKAFFLKIDTLCSDVKNGQTRAYGRRSEL
jgi:hypothetical protein